MEAAQTSICNLVTTVEHILQASEDVSSRLARIETMFAAPTGYSASALRAPIDNDDEIAQPRVSTEEPLNSDLSRKILQFDPNLESELHASRVYMRTKHRHSMSSLNSTYDSVAGLSFLSGISLAQISSISVISLPIFSYELWNPQQYRCIRSTDMSASLRAQNPTYSTISSRPDASDTNIRALAPKHHENVLREVHLTDIIGQETEHLAKVLSAMKEIYADAGLQKAVERGNVYAMYDNLQMYDSMLAWIRNVLNFDSYMARINRVFSPGCLPSDKDVLHSYLHTSGITETLFELGKGDVHVFDVGGTRSERHKWIHVFEGCDSLLFVASLAGYNECLIEDKNTVCNICLTYAPITCN